MDLSINGIARNFIDNMPLVVGISVIMWWLFPKMLNVAMRNGSGKLFAEIVKAENVAQSEVTKLMIEKAITAHEKVEDVALRSALVVVRDEIEKDGRNEINKLERRLDRIDSRTAAIEMKLFKKIPKDNRDD